MYPKYNNNKNKIIKKKLLKSLVLISMINTREIQIKATVLDDFRPTRAGPIIKNMKNNQVFGLSLAN
jgi:hypothetical protein